MNMCVHHTRQDRQSGNVDGFARVAAAALGNGGYNAVGDQNIASLKPNPWQKGNTTPEGKIHVMRHVRTPL